MTCKRGYSLNFSMYGRCLSLSRRHLYDLSVSSSFFFTLFLAIDFVSHKNTRAKPQSIPMLTYILCYSISLSSRFFCFCFSFVRLFFAFFLTVCPTTYQLFDVQVTLIRLTLGNWRETRAFECSNYF